MPTKIEWTDETLNPVVGCTKVSPACENCYAEKMAFRLRAMGMPQYQDVVDDKGHWTGKIGISLDALGKLYHWRNPRKVFMVSMGDLFHESVPFGIVWRVYYSMQQNPRHTFQILTKRPQRALEFYDWLSNQHCESVSPEWFSNLWFGFTAENQKMFDERWYYAQQIPAKVHFVSIEPMLEKIDFSYGTGVCYCGEYVNEHDRKHNHSPVEFVSSYLSDGLDWVIVGGETGHNARPMDAVWAESIRDQCRAAHVPFFFKGYGTYYYADKHELGYRHLDGKEYNEFPL